MLFSLGDPTSRVLVQLTFATPEQIAFARRFASGFYICTDATFSTNQLRMPLSTVVTTTNTGKTVPIMHSIIISEAEQVFEEMHNFMNEFMFYDIPAPKVYIGDQGAGFVSATEKLVQEDIQMQLCEWHVVENIKTMLVNSGKYLKEKRKTLEDLIWAYTKSESPAKLEAYAFRLLQGQVTNEAIRLIRDEWEVVKSDYRQFGQLAEDSKKYGPLESNHVIARTHQRLLEFYTRRFDTKDGHSKYGCYSE